MAASSALLWIHHDDDPALPKAYELRSTIKQHVMVNYHTQKTKQAEKTQVFIKSSRSNARIKDGTKSAKQITVSPHFVPSSTPKQTHIDVAHHPSPAPALIDDEHRSIYNAIWWHQYAAVDLPKRDKMDWSQRYRAEASELLWNLATEDKTFFEIFMCFSAAKEIAVKGSRDLRPYFRYKGKAMAMVSQDVNREGISLRVNAIAAISLLNRMAFAENDYEAADHHMRALQRLTAQRLRQLPGFCWLTLVWSDLHLTAVRLRGPYVAYHIHPDFRERPFSGKFQFDVDRYFSKILPGELVISSSFRAVSIRLYQELRECGYTYDQREVDWKISRGMSYEIAYLIAETQVSIDKSGTLEEQLILIGCQMQFWGMLGLFVPQRGLQTFHMSRLAGLLEPIPPSTLCTQWLEHTVNLDLFLWCLCNAAGSALHQSQSQPHNSAPSQPTQVMPDWLQQHVTHIIDLLSIVGPRDLEARLHGLPSSKAWNEPACRAFFSCRTQTDSDVTTIGVDSQLAREPYVEIFRDLRLIFDSCSDASA